MTLSTWETASDLLPLDRAPKLCTSSVQGTALKDPNPRIHWTQALGPPLSGSSLHPRSLAWPFRHQSSSLEEARGDGCTKLEMVAQNWPWQIISSGGTSCTDVISPPAVPVCVSTLPLPGKGTQQRFLAPKAPGTPLGSGLWVQEQQEPRDGAGTRSPPCTHRRIPPGHGSPPSPGVTCWGTLQRRHPLKENQAAKKLLMLQPRNYLFFSYRGN